MKAILRLHKSCRACTDRHFVLSTPNQRSCHFFLWPNAGAVGFTFQGKSLRPKGKVRVFIQAEWACLNSNTKDGPWWSKGKLLGQQGAQKKSRLYETRARAAFFLIPLASCCW
jgi:hypothetical protein